MFRQSLRKLMVPIAEFIEERLNVPLPVVRTVLRPPGALAEHEFLDKCYRCGNCMDVCPARCIRVISSDDIDTSGTPYIDPDVAACVVCDELACMRACPSGALQTVEDAGKIHMGRAGLDGRLCLRSEGQNCRVCVEKCPIGPQAVDISDRGEIVFKADGCVGCGACQFYCPTSPKAIVVCPI